MLRLLPVIMFIIVIIGNALVHWSENFFDWNIEKIELSKLYDGEGEEKEEAKKESDHKIKYCMSSNTKLFEQYIHHTGKAYFLISNHTQETPTPPPEHFLKS